MNKLKSYDQPTELNLRALLAMMRTWHSVHRRELKTIRAGGLTLTQFAVLEVLYHKGDMRVCTIIEKVQATGGNMTVVISNLEKEGLISRRPDPSDQRAHLIQITDKGTALIDAIFPSHLENINSIFNALSKEEKETLIPLLKKLSGI